MYYLVTPSLELVKSLGASPKNMKDEDKWFDLLSSEAAKAAAGYAADIK